MERQCGSCTLCCYTLAIDELDKPANVPCEHICNGCGIYEERPETCRAFRCMWLNGELPDNLRPDKVHAFAYKTADYIRVSVDPHQTAKRWELIDHVINALRTHALVTMGDQVNFYCGNCQPRPRKLVLNWNI